MENINRKLVRTRRTTKLRKIHHGFGVRPPGWSKSLHARNGREPLVDMFGINTSPSRNDHWHTGTVELIRGSFFVQIYE